MTNACCSRPEANSGGAPRTSSCAADSAADGSVRRGRPTNGQTSLMIRVRARTSPVTTRATSASRSARTVWRVMPGTVRTSPRMAAASGTPEPGSSAGTPARPPATSSPTTNRGRPGSRVERLVRELEVVEGVGDPARRGQRVGAGLLDRHVGGAALERDLPLDRAAALGPDLAGPSPGRRSRPRGTAAPTPARTSSRHRWGCAP